MQLCYSPRAAGGAAGETGAAPAGYPITFDNCGREVTVERRPERVLTIGTGAVTMLELAGAADRIVARAGEFGNPPDGAAGEAVAAVPVVAEKTPALEPVLGAKPDLVVSYGLFEDLSDADLEAAGITSMVLSGYCGNGGAGDIGDGQTAAAFYFLGGQGPYVFGNTSITTAQMEVFGLTNAFPDAQLQDPALSIETFIAADPDVLILIYGYNEGETFEQARAALLAVPGPTSMTAVADNQIVGLLGPRAEPSAGAVDGLEELARGFARLP